VNPAIKVETEFPKNLNISQTWPTQLNYTNRHIKHTHLKLC